MVISLALVLISGVFATALLSRAPNDGTTCPLEPVGECSPAPLRPSGIYFGNQAPNCAIPTRLRISNGGAGLSGLVRRLADEFIKFEGKTKNVKPFKVEWIRGDTTETLEYLRTNQADVGITYNKAAECQAINDKVAARREYGFRDHFYLVGPKAGPGGSNPAGLMPANLKNGKTESVLQQFQKIVRTGSQPPPTGQSTRFLSRYDKSATNIKESELFIRVGQVPWGLAYSKWYHEYTAYPIEALQAAARLQEYTLTDRGTWLSTDRKFTDQLTIYNLGLDNDPNDPLLNPAFFLISASSCKANRGIAERFLSWVIGPKGQMIIKSFKQNGSNELLYTGALVGVPGRNIRNCSIQSV